MPSQMASRWFRRIQSLYVTYYLDDILATLKLIKFNRINDDPSIKQREQWKKQRELKKRININEAGFDFELSSPSTMCFESAGLFNKIKTYSYFNSVIQSLSNCKE